MRLADDDQAPRHHQEAMADGSRGGHPRRPRRRRGRPRDARPAERRAGRRAGVPRRARAHQDQHHPAGERDAGREPRPRSAHGRARLLHQAHQRLDAQRRRARPVPRRPGAWVDTIKEREAQYELLFDLEPPFVFAGEVPPLRTWAERETEPTPGGRGHRRSKASPVARARPPAAPVSCSTRPTRPRSSPATCSSRRSPTRRGRRCSCPPPPWSSTSAPSSATR